MKKTRLLKNRIKHLSISFFFSFPPTFGRVTEVSLTNCTPTPTKNKPTKTFSSKQPLFYYHYFSNYLSV